jgi:hypothetical protein
LFESARASILINDWKNDKRTLYTARSWLGSRMRQKLVNEKKKSAEILVAVLPTPQASCFASYVMLNTIGCQETRWSLTALEEKQHGTKLPGSLALAGVEYE